MNLIGSDSQENLDSAALIVLVPLSINDDLLFVRRIRSTKSGNQKIKKIVFISLVKNQEEQLWASRFHSTLFALLCGEQLLIGSVVSFEKDWIKVIRSVWKNGDEILCHTEQTVRTGLFNQGPLDDLLKSAIPCPVIRLTGVVSRENKISPNRTYRGLIYWIGAIVLIVGFFFIQAEAQIYLHGWVNSVALIIVVIIEFFLLWLINIFTS